MMRRRRKLCTRGILMPNSRFPQQVAQSTSSAVNVEVDTTTSLLGPGTSGPGGDNEDIMVHGEPIPPQILAEIFMRIDRKMTVGCICPMVCRRWHNVLSAAGFWIDYMRRRSRIIPPPALRSEQLLNMKKVCLKQPFERNLIGNPSGEKNFHGWTVLDNGGDRIIIERPPLNCSANLHDEIPVAFVTSYGWGTMRYVVDLWEEGIEAAFLDTYRPPITVSEYFTCRRDCAAVYALQVELVPDGQERRISNNVVPRDHWGDDLPEQQDVTTNKSVAQIHRMEQWSSAEWQRVEHTFEDYPVGIRFVVFEHSGKDLQFWAGHYGSKMAKASVIVHFGDGHKRTSTTIKEGMDRALNEAASAQVEDIIQTEVLPEMRTDIRAEVVSEIRDEVRQIREMMADIVSEFNASVQQVLEETMTMIRSIKEMIISTQSTSAPKEEAEQDFEERKLC